MSEQIMSDYGLNASDVNPTGDPVIETKELRVALDAVVQVLKTSKRQSKERSTAQRKTIEAVMWLGMELKALKEEGLAGDMPNPYPSSYDPTNNVVEPTADGLKL